MTSLTEIQHHLAQPMAQLNAMIATATQSSSPLMNSILENYLSVKGKQLRPMLVLLSAELFGGVNQVSLSAGASMELLHNATLIHDDVIDQSSTRRGKPTINSMWDNHISVLVGDFMITAALECCANSGNINIIKALARVGSELSTGEINQIDTARHRNITEAEYMKIVSSKTASLFETCVEVGALSAGATSQQTKAIMQYAKLLGICFQIKDDTFDYFDNDKVGKPTGNDLLEGKVTLPLIYALSRTELPHHHAMNTLVAKDVLNPNDVAQLVAFARNSGGIDYAYSVMQQLRNEAVSHLKCYGENNTTEALIALFDYIIAREL